jgi:hypothetical protein
MLLFYTFGSRTNLLYKVIKKYRNSISSREKKLDRLVFLVWAEPEQQHASVGCTWAKAQHAMSDRAGGNTVNSQGACGVREITRD